ncbi:hypothetical protein [Acetobacter okinawensis]|uniref:hypothetical protein n=1 Tax=Acetobacter okinawensis TaxID=1076594 RepID=UPI0020A1088E|nr:hypothetical protein [Acetobacter okinawensis]MCP1212623.1 hypothetical protein [Acetobacter okinawensis]
MMTLSFPEWVPLWGQLLALAVGIVFGLAFMMMPFAVFGVKSRLSELSLQLEELQAELRARAMQGNGVSAGYASGAAEGPLPFVARRTDAPVVEEVRPPVAEKNQPPRSTPVFVELRAPRVSDAYEPRLDAPPAPHIEPDSYKAAPARRMPWHEEQPPEAESGAEILRRQRAPDANQVAYRPDFSHEQSPTRPSVSETRYDAHTGRAEPVLHFPSRNRP